jgi:putative hydrolase of the HAD superfamily
MNVRAVIFDYGMVLTSAPDATAYGEMLHITGLSREQFEPLYWADRHAYDEGKLSGITFWKKFVADARLTLPAGSIEELNRLDALHWTTENPRMVAWQAALKRAGIKTAILSNMGDNVHESLLRSFKWVNNFDHCTWSYQLGIAKPDPQIYTYTLEKLGAKAEETLFLDDRQVNIDAAHKLGLVALLFSDVEQLKVDLIRLGWGSSLPLPN